MSEILKTSFSSDVCFLIIDDTLNNKYTSTKYIESLDFHNSHTDGNKPIGFNYLVTEYYEINILLLSN